MSDRLVLMLYVLSFAFLAVLVKLIARLRGRNNREKRPYDWLLVPGLLSALVIFASYELTLGAFAHMENASTWMGVVGMLGLVVGVVMVTGMLLQAIVLPLVRLLIRIIMLHF